MARVGLARSQGVFRVRLPPHQLFDPEVVFRSDKRVIRLVFHSLADLDFHAHRVVGADECVPERRVVGIRAREVRVIREEGVNDAREAFFVVGNGPALVEIETVHLCVCLLFLLLSLLQTSTGTTTQDEFNVPGVERGFPVDQGEGSTDLAGVGVGVET